MSRAMLHVLWREFYFFLTRVIPVATLSLALGLVVIRMMAPAAPIGDLAVALMIPLMLFQVFMRVLGATVRIPPTVRMPEPFARIEGTKGRLTVAILVYGMVLVCVGIMFILAWPIYGLVGLRWPVSIIGLLAAAHVAGGFLLIMVSVTIATLMVTLSRRDGSSGHSLSGMFVVAAGRYRDVHHKEAISSRDQTWSATPASIAGVTRRVL